MGQGGSEGVWRKIGIKDCGRQRKQVVNENVCPQPRINMSLAQRKCRLHHGAWAQDLRVEEGRSGVGSSCESSGFRAVDWQFCLPKQPGY